MVNKELEKEACHTFVCPNISLIDEACKKVGISPEIIETTKDLAVEYFKRTYHRPRYGSVKLLLPAFLYIALNMQIRDGKRVVDVWGRARTDTEYTQSLCSLIFGANVVTTRKWVIDIVTELKIDYYSGPSVKLVFE